MTRFLPLAATAALALLAAGPAHAWGAYGHETIAEIAMANVKPQTRAAVKRLLSHSALLDTPGCRADTPDAASTWADCIRGLKDANGDRPYAATPPWHYQDVNICQPFAIAPVCPDGNCVSAQITRDEKLLADRRTPEKERVRALVFLIHFVGDLHQPLHAGEKNDKGANDVRAAYGLYDPPRENLHSIWDTQLAERAISTGPSLVRRYPPTVKARVGAGTVTDWSRQSWQIARDVVYPSVMGGGDPCRPTPPKVTMDEPTAEKLIPVVRLQVERGGLRLAKLLDRALG